MAENQALLRGFFRSAMPMLRPGGEINITLKKGKPYDLWNLKGLGAKLTLGSMKYETALHFDVDAYPGYTHRRTIGFKEGVSATDRACLYAIQITSTCGTDIALFDREPQCPCRVPAVPCPAIPSHAVPCRTVPCHAMQLVLDRSDLNRRSADEDLVGSRCLTHVWRSTVRAFTSAPPQWLYGSVS